MIQSAEPVRGQGCQVFSNRRVLEFQPFARCFCGLLCESETNSEMLFQLVDEFAETNGFTEKVIASRVHYQILFVYKDAGCDRNDFYRLTILTGFDPTSRLEPVLLEADHTAMAGQILRLAPRRALVVIFTDLVPAVIEEGLLPALPALTARHVVLVTALGDPRVAEMGRTDRSAGTDPLPAIDDVAEAYGAAAATRSLLARARAAEMLRRRGVEVVDAPPHRFASDVSDAYLALKAAGRL